MTALVFQHVRHLGRHLRFFKTFIFSKNAANFLEISRKHVYTAVNTNTIKNRMEKDIKTNFVEKLVFAFRPAQTLICIINFALITSADVIKLTSKDVLVIGPQVLKVSF